LHRAGPLRRDRAALRAREPRAAAGTEPGHSWSRVMKRLLVALVALPLLASCAVGPQYRRPTVPVPAQFRGAEPTTSLGSLADLEWFRLFDDEVLNELIATALEQNFDLRIAAERVLEARSQLGKARAEQFPRVDTSGAFVRNRGSSAGALPFIPRGTNLDVSYTQVGFTLGWELDLWGRVRRLTEAARAEYLASEDVRRGVVTTLVSDVTATYFSLRELDLDLEIA